MLFHHPHSLPIIPDEGEGVRNGGTQVRARFSRRGVPLLEDGPRVDVPRPAQCHPTASCMLAPASYGLTVGYGLETSSFPTERSFVSIHAPYSIWASTVPEGALTWWVRKCFCVAPPPDPGHLFPSQGSLELFPFAPRPHRRGADEWRCRTVDDARPTVVYGVGVGPGPDGWITPAAASWPR